MVIWQRRLHGIANHFTCRLDYDQLNSGDYFSNCSVEKLKELAKNQDRIDEMMNFTKKQILMNCSDLPKNLLDYI